MNIILADISGKMIDAWRLFCGDLEGVTIVAGSILEVECDAVVSPANSFGFMDGGIDMLYSQHFGWHVQERLQALIKARHYGELIIGAAEIVATDDEKIPYLIAAPTMRIPMILKATVNPYLACRAALILGKHGVFPAGKEAGRPVSEFVRSIAFPGLGTGVGQVKPDACARQMRAAIEEILLGVKRFPNTWVEASHQHDRMAGFDPSEWRNP